MKKYQSNEAKLFSAKFKRDYVASLAVILFFLILVCEVGMAISLPLMVRRQELWERQVSKQEMATFFDSVRDGMRYVSEKSKDRIAGESNLIVVALDETAIYLRRNVDFLNQEQINRINAELNRIPVFKNHYAGKKKPYSSQLELNMDKYLKKLEQQYKTTTKEKK